ncbi:MAG: peptidylprolyl isomerase [Candidatus Omnitrophica bacterium]|nr:peptidylprolyl isomerase [Candidatus Omnitrophota bacterium]
MLSALRKKKVAKRVLWVLAILIIPAFVLFGVGKIGKKRIAGFSYVGFIKGKKIGIDDFFKARRGIEIQILLNYFGQKELLDKILKDRALLNKLTWERIVMLEEAGIDRIKVSDNQIIGFITSHPLFINNGVFDEKFYNYMLTRNLGINARTFEEEIRKSLKVARLKDNILSSVPVTDEEALKAYKEERETGKISYIRVEKEEFRDSIGIQEEEIESYYQKFKHNFRIPEKINLQYMECPYRNPEEKEILLKKMQQRLKKSQDLSAEFLSIAEIENKSIEETELFSKNELPSRFNWGSNVYDMLFGIGTGTVRIIIDEMPEGSLYLVKIKEKIPARLMTKQETAPKIQDLLRDEKAEMLVKDKSNAIYNLMHKKNISLEKAALHFNSKVDKTGLISRFDYVEGIGDAYDILDSLFKSKPEAVSNPFKTRKGYVIARLDEFHRIDTEKFNEEKEVYRNKVLAIKKEKALEDWLARISKDTHLAIDIRRL